jgi:hypothetical protein
MRREIIQCDTCAKQYDLKDGLLPASWATLVQRNHYDQHFCSYICHADWARKHFGISEPAQPLEQPQTKIRRFWLVDGETAELTEGIVWSHGEVSLDGGTPHIMNFHCQANFRNWDDFKKAHSGDGVQWIDQEVKEEELAHAAD